jgi:hypothetical protein
MASRIKIKEDTLKNHHKTNKQTNNQTKIKHGKKVMEIILSDIVIG